MEKYKIDLNQRIKRQKYFAIAWVLICLSIIAINALFIKSTVNPAFLTSFATFFTLMFPLNMFLKSRRTKLLLNDDKKLEQKFLLENDERNLLIQSKSNEATLGLTVWLIVFVMFISAYFSETYTLAIALIFISLLIFKIVTHKYFSKKY